jgi:hypothetical protein
MIVAPILILMIGLGMINWLLPGSEAETTVQMTAASEVVVLPSTRAEPSELVAATPPMLGVATPWGVLGRNTESSPVPSPSVPTVPTPLPSQISPDTVIELLGPPGETLFRLNDSISFYWNWPLALEVNQRFAVYLRASGNEWLLGTVDENNMGTSFRLRATPAELVAEPAQYQWLVRLEMLSGTDENITQVLLESDARPLTLTDG